MSTTPDTAFRRLAKAARTAGIRTEADLLALAARLSPAESLLFRHLHDAGAEGLDGAELRQLLAGQCANVSAAAAVINRKLTENGMTAYRIACTLERGTRHGMASRWRLDYLAELDAPATGTRG